MVEDERLRILRRAFARLEGLIDFDGTGADLIKQIREETTLR